MIAKELSVWKQTNTPIALIDDIEMQARKPLPKSIENIQLPGEFETPYSKTTRETSHMHVRK